MRGGALARRYARAVFELAEEQGAQDKVRQDLDALAEAWKVSEELRSLFENPAVNTEQRRSVIEALAERLELSAIVKHTLMLLSDRRRLRHLPEVVDAFDALAESKAGRIRAEVITAGEMPEEYFQQLEKTLESVTGKKVMLHRKQDSSLIAGVVTRVGDKVFDGSLKTRLEELKDDLLTHPGAGTQ